MRLQKNVDDIPNMVEQSVSSFDSKSPQSAHSHEMKPTLYQFVMFLRSIEIFVTCEILIGGHHTGCSGDASKGCGPS